MWMHNIEKDIWKLHTNQSIIFSKAAKFIKNLKLVLKVIITVSKGDEIYKKKCIFLEFRFRNLFSRLSFIKSCVIKKISLRKCAEIILVLNSLKLYFEKKT